MNGITLVTLVVTVIVLLILLDVSLTMANHLIIEKSVTAATQTIEASLQEKIEIAWMEAEIDYWENEKSIFDMSKEEYCRKQLIKNLAQLNEFDIKEENNCIKIRYQNKEYEFYITSEGKVSCTQLLKGNVKPGDYIEYPVEYKDVYTDKTYTATNGWRVLDDGVMKGTTGKVRIISAQVPYKWSYTPIKYQTSQEAINDLVNNFENVVLENNCGEAEEFVKGSIFKVEGIAEKVTTLTSEDLNYAYNEMQQTNRAPDDISSLSEKNDLFYFATGFYWLRTISKQNDKNIYYVRNGIIEEDYNSRMGIRPVIELKEDLKGIIDKNVWKIIK